MASGPGGRSRECLCVQTASLLSFAASRIRTRGRSHREGPEVVSLPTPTPSAGALTVSGRTGATSGRFRSCPALSVPSGPLSGPAPLQAVRPEPGEEEQRPPRDWRDLQTRGQFQGEGPRRPSRCSGAQAPSPAASGDALGSHFSSMSAFPSCFVFLFLDHQSLGLVATCRRHALLTAAGQRDSSAFVSAAAGDFPRRTSRSGTAQFPARL